MGKQGKEKKAASKNHKKSSSYLRKGAKKPQKSK
jgi:hypothetical protein